MTAQLRNVYRDNTYESIIIIIIRVALNFLRVLYQS